MFLFTTNSARDRSVAIRMLACALFVVPFFTNAQNLVPNPSFEELDSCPRQTGYVPSSRPTGWYSTSETPDYFHVCSTTPSLGVPENQVTFQYPQDGEAYSGMFAFLPIDYREMIGVDLVEPLEIGTTYYASFYVNAAFGGAEQSRLACNNIGLLFTMEPYVWDFGMALFGLRNYAQVHSDAIITDTIGWTLVSGSFVADSAYQYMVVGNHYTNANTQITDLGPGSYRAYELVDQFCVSADPNGCPMVTEVNSLLDLEFRLGPSPASDHVSVIGPSLVGSIVKITDPSGKLVSVLIMETDQLSLEVSGWANGVYMMHFEKGNERSVQRFVVMH